MQYWLIAYNLFSVIVRVAFKGISEVRCTWNALQLILGFG